MEFLNNVNLWLGQAAEALRGEGSAVLYTTLVRFLLPVVAALILLRCVRSLMMNMGRPETWAYLALPSGERMAVNHWENTIGELTGPVDTLIFPYGSEVDYASEKLSWLTGEGFEYFIGLWPSDDYREVQDEYMRQTRRMVNGYMLKNSPNLFSTFFSVSGILDEERP